MRICLILFSANMHNFCVGVKNKQMVLGPAVSTRDGTKELEQIGHL